ncbi:MAG: diaminopimelate epimerase [Firmicutes bacterium]|nr:diaminopimelate epimerase [Bacillota bacterium]
MEFIKMHGLGNDFVITFCRTEDEADTLLVAAPRLCDRHFGIGADGVIAVMLSAVADIRMRTFNPDGSEAQMCGNAIRCVARAVEEHWTADLARGLASGDPLRVETLGGLKRVWVTDRGPGAWRVRVDMGEPSFGQVPQVEQEFDIGGRKVVLTLVSMGNPHAVTFVPRLDRAQMLEMGPRIETSEHFPDRTNVEFVSVAGDTLHVLVWERGAGPTLACGTGACASLVAAARTGRSSRRAAVELPGGLLEVEWAQDNHVYMTGAAEEVFTGQAEVSSFLPGPGTVRSRYEESGRV